MFSRLKKFFFLLFIVLRQYIMLQVTSYVVQITRWSGWYAYGIYVICVSEKMIKGNHFEKKKIIVWLTQSFSACVRDYGKIELLLKVFLLNIRLVFSGNSASRNHIRRLIVYATWYSMITLIKHVYAKQTYSVALPKTVII